MRWEQPDFFPVTYGQFSNCHLKAKIRHDTDHLICVSRDTIRGLSSNTFSSLQPKWKTTIGCQWIPSEVNYMGQVTKVRLSCYLVLLSCMRAKPGNKTATPSWHDPCVYASCFTLTFTFLHLARLFLHVCLGFPAVTTGGTFSRALTHSATAKGTACTPCAPSVCFLCR